MKRLFGFLFLSCFGLLFIDCSGDEGSGVIPVVEEPMRNRLECFVDDAFMEADSLFAMATYHEGTMTINGYKHLSDGGQSIYVFIKDPVVNKVYDLTELPDNMAYYGRDFTTMHVDGCIFTFDMTRQGTARITKMDTVHFIVSGTFEFSSEHTNPACGVSRIRNGKFEMRYLDSRFANL